MPPLHPGLIVPTLTSRSTPLSSYHTLPACTPASLFRTLTLPLCPLPCLTAPSPIFLPTHLPSPTSLSHPYLPITPQPPCSPWLKSTLFLNIFTHVSAVCEGLDSIQGQSNCKGLKTSNTIIHQSTILRLLIPPPPQYT